MAANPLDCLGLTEAELVALGRAAKSRLAGRAFPASGKFRRKTPASAGGNFQGFREYAAGDSLRAVNWRASARSDHVQTQLYESELASKWYICLDGSASMAIGAGRAKWLLARQIAAAFAYLLLYWGNPVGLLVFSGKVDACCPPGRSHSQYPKLLNLLNGCLPNSFGGQSLLEVCASRFPPSSSLLVVSDFLDDGAMQATLGQWLSGGAKVHAIQVLAADDCDLPLHESLVIRDIETGERRWLNSEPGMIQFAKQSLGEISAGLDAYCGKRRIPFTTVDPIKGWKEGVLQHLKKTSPHS